MIEELEVVRIEQAEVEARSGIDKRVEEIMLE